MPSLQFSEAPFEALDSFVAWVRDIAIPVWAEKGFDPATGLFQESLDFQARPIEMAHRAIVQARQVYVFAQASLLGWHDRGAILASQGAAQLIDAFCINSGDHTAVVFAVNRIGEIATSRRDTYTHAFVLFAFAWMYKLTGEGHFLDIADRIQAFITAELVDHLYGGTFDYVGAADSIKSQNPMMHLLEAYLALDAAAPARGYLEHAIALIATSERTLIRRGIVVERSAFDWSESANGGNDDRWEPGHHYEWAWLLDSYAEQSGIGWKNQASNLRELAATHGHAPNGLIYDELSRDLAIKSPHHRLWPHTEAIKAALFQRCGNETCAVTFAGKMAALLMTHFLNRPFVGGWIDRIDNIGTPHTDRVPASSLYHLTLAAAEADKAMRKLSNAPGIT